MDKIFKYPEKLPITLKRHIDAVIDAYEAIARRLSPDDAQEIAPHFQTQIDKLLLNIEEEKRLSRIEIAENKKAQNLLRIAIQRELKETLLKNDKLRKQKIKEAEEARLKAEKKLRDELEREEGRRRIKEWDRNENLFIASFIISLILFFTLISIAPAFLSLFFIIAFPFFVLCIDYDFLKRPRPNFSSLRGPSEIKVNIPTREIEDAVQKAIVTSTYQFGLSSQTSETISRGIQKALGDMKYK